MNNTKTLYCFRSSSTAISSPTWLKQEHKYERQNEDVYYQKNDLFVYLEVGPFVQSSFFIHVRTGKIVNIYDEYVEIYRKTK